MSRKLREHVRIIVAITAKDIKDAMKNRTTLSVLVISLLMVIFYRYMPILTGDGSASNLLIVDTGSSTYWENLEASTDPKVYGPYLTQGYMEQDLIRGDTPELGLVLPRDFDQQVAAGGEIELSGYVMSWVGKADVARLESAAEELLRGIVGSRVDVVAEGNVVYPQVDVFGFPLLYSLGLVIGMLMVGVLMTPNLMIEEKQARTVDALMVSPASSFHVVAAKALTGVFYCLIMAGVGALFSGRLVLHWWLFCLAAVAGSLLSVGVGLLLGAVFENRQQITTWGFFLSFPLMLPLFLSWMKGLLPDPLLSLLRWFPTVAMGRMFRASFSEPAVMRDVELGLLLVLGCALLLLAAVACVLRRSDRRRSRRNGQRS